MVDLLKFTKAYKASHLMLSMTNLPHRAAARKGIKPPANHSLAANGAQPSRNHPSSEPFLVKLLNGRIKICTGCKGPY